MTVTKAHPFNHLSYTSKHSDWKDGAVAAFLPQLRILGTLPHKPDSTKDIGGTSVTVRVYNQEKKKKEKLQCIRAGVEAVQAAFPNLQIPALEFHCVHEFNIPDETSPSGIVKITCVANHLDEDKSNKVRVFLTKALWEGVPEHTPVIESGGKFISKGMKPFFHNYGPMGSVRGIADYLWQDAKKSEREIVRGTAVVVHEIGHVLHQLHNTNSFWALNCRPGDFTISDSPKNDISTYGGSCPVEWIAEVFTAKVMGFKLTTAVEWDYRALDGPGAANIH